MKKQSGKTKQEDIPQNWPEFSKSTIVMKKRSWETILDEKRLWDMTTDFFFILDLGEKKELLTGYSRNWQNLIMDYIWKCINAEFPKFMIAL